MAGLLLCAFFLLGVMTGFSEPGRRVALRAKLLVEGWADRAIASLGPLRHAAGHFDQSIVPVEALLHLRHPSQKPVAKAAPAIAHSPARDDTIAIVERGDGFYALHGDGEIRGPVSPSQQPDLPILSGPGAQNALAGELLDDAAQLVRAEAQLSSLVSEMRVADDRSASFFLDRARMEIVVDLDQEQAELRRANEVLKRWQGRERLIAMLDMTTPGMAIVRLKTELPRPDKRAPELAHKPAAAHRRVRIAERGR
jgi:cell division protein FtsQ